jgi:lipopolysaccharide transport system ATP-binding protein
VIVGEPAIQVRGLGKRYRVGPYLTWHNTLRDALADAARGSIRATQALFSRRRQDPEEGHFWALRDVSFDVSNGEALGIIGANGAGKSTLLKLLSRITEPTAGEARIRGRVGSLLEVGTGFHSELTGRENTYLSGAILGMRRGEIDRKFDDIVSFAEVERFIDTPVKHYSSGMYLRLAFSVAAHLEPEILIVDEVLAVGDAEFQKKCIGKMDDVTHRDGRTVCFVSHNTTAVRRLCDRCILLDHGQIVGMGAPAEMIQLYQTAGRAGVAPGRWIELGEAWRRGTGAARFTRLLYTSDNEGTSNLPYTDGPLRVVVEIESSVPLEASGLGLTIYDGLGSPLVSADILTHDERVGLVRGVNRVGIEIESLHLRPGSYRLGLGLMDQVHGVLDRLDTALDLEVVENPAAGMTPFRKDDGIVSCDFTVRPV